jgi:hypothetical protein
MAKPKDVPLIISCLQLLALKEILQSPSFIAKDKGELKWLFDLIDKTTKLDDLSGYIWKE